MGLKMGAGSSTAGAGNTISVVTVVSALPVYPRWRGEHFKLFFDIGLSDGLSPLARGTRTA
ncbi:TPA: hypothetical protein HIT53_002214 [Escherichia fergusonii]|nr:hypothetical protein [Escherichia fergusonii]